MSNAFEVFDLFCISAPKILQTSSAIYWSLGVSEEYRIKHLPFCKEKPFKSQVSYIKVILSTSVHNYTSNYMKLYWAIWKLCGPDPQWSVFDFQQLKIWPTNFCKAHEHSDNSYFKVFRSGTKLIVSNIQAKFDSTKIQVLPPSTEQDGKVSYMCLIQDFYPNVIKVTWEVDKKNVEENAVHEEIWDPDTNQQLYSMSSWLTVDKNSNKNYRCKYQHESKEGSRPIESPDTSVVSQTTESCINKPENGTTLSTDITDSFMHRTAYLIYIVLLLKSTTYYVIVLFFIYRMQSPIKHRGKKP
ncbi:uncharacterized protein LOC102935213 isoform X3 [Chelonia mydas]|uniref:uncharacterized protein LOC102935213 isoform X3 n=1 Tax=Chelonia mydas TaxID=8469 RepID=UPI001CA9E7A2|nr:uncharacterized protein LOC102935213 isoform X3 [Chelonia mydas]